MKFVTVNICTLFLFAEIIFAASETSNSSIDEVTKLYKAMRCTIDANDEALNPTSDAYQIWTHYKYELEMITEKVRICSMHGDQLRAKACVDKIPLTNDNAINEFHGKLKNEFGEMFYLDFLGAVAEASKQCFDSINDTLITPQSAKQDTQTPEPEPKIEELYSIPKTLDIDAQQPHKSTTTEPKVESKKSKNKKQESDIKSENPDLNSENAGSDNPEPDSNLKSESKQPDAKKQKDSKTKKSKTEKQNIDQKAKSETKNTEKQKTDSKNQKSKTEAKKSGGKQTKADKSGTGKVNSDSKAQKSKAQKSKADGKKSESQKQKSGGKTKQSKQKSKTETKKSETKKEKSGNKKTGQKSKSEL